MIVVDVEQKQVERGNSLRNAGFYGLPVFGRQDARNNVERQDPVDGVPVRVNREGDSEIEQFTLRVARPPPQRGTVEAVQAPADLPGVPEPATAEHFAEIAAGIVIREWAGEGVFGHRAVHEPSELALPRP